MFQDETEEDIKMKLTIKEINRKTNRTMKTWIHEYSDMKDCLKVIKRLDKQFLKRYFKFKYIIEE